MCVCPMTRVSRSHRGLGLPRPRPRSGVVFCVVCRRRNEPASSLCRHAGGPGFAVVNAGLRVCVPPPPPPALLVQGFRRAHGWDCSRGSHWAGTVLPAVREGARRHRQQHRIARATRHCSAPVVPAWRPQGPRLTLPSDPQEQGLG